EVTPATERWMRERIARDRSPGTSASSAKAAEAAQRPVAAAPVVRTDDAPHGTKTRDRLEQRFLDMRGEAPAESAEGVATARGGWTERARLIQRFRNPSGASPAAHSPSEAMVQQS